MTRPVRFGSPIDGRCEACGIAVDAADAESLLRRAERLLFLAEQIAVKARNEDDARLSLMAVDRARSALEVLMRAHGMLSGDQQINVTIDQRQQGLVQLGKLSDNIIRRMNAGDRTVLDAVLAATEGAQPPLESGTD